MDILTQMGVGLLSIVITLVASFAANLMPRQGGKTEQTRTVQSTTPEGRIGLQEPMPGTQTQAAQTPSENHVEYASLQSASLGKELKFAIQFPPSYEKEPK